MADNKRSNYQVGYGKPPRHSRFPKGQSGNRRGRPKGNLNLTTVLQKALMENVAVEEQGTRKHMRKIDVAIRQQINKAAAGDIQAFKLLTGLLRDVGGSSGIQKPYTIVISEVDGKL